MIFSAMTLREKLKYSGALEDYPFLEELEYIEDDFNEDYKELEKEYDFLEEERGNMRDLLETINTILEYDRTPKNSYKSLKETIQQAIENSYVEF